MTERVVVVGASGHGKVLCDVIEKVGIVDLVGLVDEDPDIVGTFAGHEVLGNESDLPNIVQAHGVSGAIVAIGDNWVRAQVVARIRTTLPKLQFPSIVSPSAEIAQDVEIGEGCFIGPGAVVNTGSRVGSFCILNTRAAVDHDGVLAEYCSLAPNVALGGNVQIGAYTAISLGANVTHAVRIGEHSVIGAGALVLRDIGDHVVAYGAPARMVRLRSEGEPYLGNRRKPEPARCEG
jgi:sugar O-acyltransferase (sialic acid O-acetyltransferase NeuD family)